MDTNDIEGQRAGKPRLPDEAKNAVRLMWRNVDVDAYNLRRLRELESTSEFSYKRHATDSAVGAHSRTKENQVLHNLKKLPTQKTRAALRNFAP